MADGTPASHFELEMVATQLRQTSDDLALYAGFLLSILTAALPPDLVEVRRESRLKARLAGRQPSVLGVSVLLGEFRFTLDRSAVGALATTAIRHESGGVTLSTNIVGIANWSRMLAEALVQLAEHDAAAAAALRRLTTP
jgi:hypothetical protein